MVVYRAQIFADRLRELCSTQPSYAFVADELGISRQQLSRYLAGNTVPRDGMLASISQFFDISLEKLFSNDSALKPPGPNGQGGTTDALAQLFADSLQEEITEHDLVPGYYRQYKELFTEPGRYLLGLARIYVDQGVFRYKRRTSCKYATQLRGSDLRNSFRGVITKQHGCLLMFDAGTRIKDVTFHTLRTRYKYDTNVKFGYHMNTFNANDDLKKKRAVFILDRVREDESVYEAARSQGIYDFQDLPENIQVMLN